MKAKIRYLLLTIISIVSLISVGFSSWVISLKITEHEDGMVSVDKVISDDYLSIKETEYFKYSYQGFLKDYIFEDGIQTLIKTHNKMSITYDVNLSSLLTYLPNTNEASVFVSMVFNNASNTQTSQLFKYLSVSISGIEIIDCDSNTIAFDFEYQIYNQTENKKITKFTMDFILDESIVSDSLIFNSTSPLFTNNRDEVFSFTSFIKTVKGGVS